MFLSFSPIFRKKSFSVRALHKQGVGVIKCSDMFTFYPCMVLILSLPNLNTNASYLSTSKFKVSFVCHFYFPAVYFGDINLLPFLQRFWLMLCVLGHLCLARTTQFSADHDFYYSTRTKILQLSNRNLAIPNLQMCLGMQLT